MPRKFNILHNFWIDMCIRYGVGNRHLPLGELLNFLLPYEKNEIDIVR